MVPLPGYPVEFMPQHRVVVSVRTAHTCAFSAAIPATAIADRSAWLPAEAAARRRHRLLAQLGRCPG